MSDSFFSAEDHKTLNSARHLAVAHAFYCETLNGRRVWRGGQRCPSSQLCFRLAGTVIVTGPTRRRARVELAIHPDVAEALAERCWDRGFTVRARRLDDGRSRLTLIDPFGLEITLKPIARAPANAA